MVSEAGCVRIVFFNAQLGLVIQQAIQHVRGVAHRRIDDLGVKRRVLIGDVQKEQYTRFVAVLRVPISAGLTVPPARKRWLSDDEVVPSPKYAAKGRPADN